MKIDYELIKKIFNRKIELVNQKDKISLSQYSDYIPMYDIFSDNIYPINSLKLYYRLVNCHYRFINDEVKQWIENKMNKSTDEFKSKYKTMLEIIKNYDLDILEKTAYETLYKYSPDFGLSISICKRNSFHPYSLHLNPYYTKNELIKLGMNNMLITKLEPSNLVDKKLHYEICKKVSKNDISYETIINHMKHIIDNNSIGWIVFYSMTGSYLINSILRSKKIKMPEYMFNGLTKILDTMNKVELPNDYYFYRFVWDDDFLKHLRIGDIFTDNGILSTTRDPFYSPGLKMDFGLILLRINIPEHIKGSGLLIENFSMFPKEEEFLIPPFTKLKLKAKDEKATYYHINEKFEKLIKKRYEFDLISTKSNQIDNIIIEPNENIPKIDIYELELNGNDRISLFDEFLYKCDKNGHFRVDDTIFLAQWFDSTGSYSNMYKNKTKDGFIITHYHEGYPLLSIEMGELLYVNYFRTICAYDNNIENRFTDDFDLLIANFAKIFKYKTANVLFNYKNFTSFKYNYSKDIEFLSTKLYCSTLYDYYKNNINNERKYYKFDYGFWMLDKIGKTEVSNNIINKLPKEIQSKYTWKELYIIIVEKYFYMYKRLEEWMNNEFNNLFEKIYFNFNIVAFLKNKGYNINEFPSITHLTTRNRGDIFKIIFEDNIRRT
jgi:hypothetical protein